MGGGTIRLPGKCLQWAAVLSKSLPVERSRVPAMASPTRYDSEEDEDSLEEVLSALVAIFGYLGLFILGVLGCVAVAVLRSATG